MISEARNERIKILRQYLLEDEHDHFSRYALALELMETGDVVGAIQHFKMVVSLNPSFLAAYYQLGKALEKESGATEAASIYEQGMTVARQQKNVKTESELRMALDSLTDDGE
jgi:tetratricopeptide (TPR) repeat protein